jgi:hypothetical protein
LPGRCDVPGNLRSVVAVVSSGRRPREEGLLLRRLVSFLPCVLIPLLIPAIGANANRAGTPRGQIRVHIPEPGGVVSAFGAIWVQSGHRKALWKVSPSGRVLQRIPGVSRVPPVYFSGVGGGGLRTVGAGFGSIWSLIGRRVLRIDPATGDVQAVVPVGGDATCLAVGAGAVWIANARGRLIRIDPVTGAVSRSRGEGATPAAIAAGARHVWWLNVSEAASISVFDSEGRRIVRDIQEPLRAFVVVARHLVWSAGRDGRIAQLRSGSGRFSRRRSVADKIMGISSGRGVVWINAGDLIGVDAKTGRVVRRHPVARAVNANAGVALLGDRVWLAEPATNGLVSVSL